MTSIKVIDLNEEAKEETPTLETIEEAKEEAPEEVINEVVEETKEETKEEVKEEVKAKPKPKASDIVPCPDCSKNMTYKNLRYSHKCYPEPPPVKKQAKPKAKTKPKPKPPLKYITAIVKMKKCQLNHSTRKNSQPNLPIPLMLCISIINYYKSK